MKKAVIVEGPHFSGKSRTIKVHFKPLVGISGNCHSFSIDGHGGAVLSQSLEERYRNGRVLSQSLEERKAANVAKIAAKYQRYELLVFAARPSNEPGSLYGTLKSELESRGFSVSTVSVVKGQPDSYYAERAQEILQHLL